MLVSPQKTDNLALERTRLANQRTALSFARTFIGFLGGGISAIVLPSYEPFLWLAYIFIAAALITLLVGALNYWRSHRRMQEILDS